MQPRTRQGSHKKKTKKPKAKKKAVKKVARHHVDPEVAKAELASHGIICAWLLDPHQIEIYRELLTTEHTDILLFISRRWGKSVMTVAFCVELALNMPGTMIRYAAATLKQAHEIVNDIMEPLILPYIGKQAKKNRSELVWKFANGSSLRLGTIERAHVDTLRGGGSADIVVIDEGAAAASSDEYEYAYRSVLGPAVMRKKKAKIFHVTTPSEQPDHFVHTEILPKCQLAGTYYERDIRTNTSLEPWQIDRAIELAGGIESDACQRELFCKIIKSAKRSLVPADVTAKEFLSPECYHALVAIDTGGVRDLTVFLLCAYDFLANKLLFIDEIWFKPNTNSAIIMQEVKAWEEPYLAHIKHRWADGSGQLLLDFQQIYGYNASLPIKQDWLANVNKLRSELESGAAIIHPRCKLLLATVKNGMLNKQRTDFERTEALGHCDAFAAAMYAVRMADMLKESNPYPRVINPVTEWAGMRSIQKDENLESFAKMFGNKRRR